MFMILFNFRYAFSSMEKNKKSKRTTIIFDRSALPSKDIKTRKIAQKSSSILASQPSSTDRKREKGKAVEEEQGNEDEIEEGKSAKKRRLKK